MLMLPHLIDVLSGRIECEEMIVLLGAEVAIPHFIDQVNRAEKFAFGDIPLEENKHTWLQPEITPVEAEAWDMGLIPLPAPICWYEVILGGNRSGFLVVGEPGNVEVTRVDFDPKPGRGVFSGLSVQRQGKCYVMKGPARAIETARKIQKTHPAILNGAADHYLAVYLTLMLSSLTTEVTQTSAPDRLNRARMKADKTPLPDHRTVVIVPDRYIDRGEHQGGTHRSPRLHWRRSHIRHYEHRTPGSQWAASETHKGVTGWWVTLIARQLVGKKELGEVTHDYFVRDKEKKPT